MTPCGEELRISQFDEIDVSSHDVYLVIDGLAELGRAWMLTGSVSSDQLQARFS